MARRASKQPTDGELEILKILWESGPTELKTIRDGLRQERIVATTTIATMLGVMLEKGLVRRTNGPRGYRWSAVMSRKTAARSMLGKIVDRMFDGSASLLVAHLIEDGKLTDAERKKIESMLHVKKPSKPKAETR
ncbi:MAG: BlaI/MecI/CopY family transcriptional regulator [Pirellulales bacterium]